MKQSDKAHILSQRFAIDPAYSAGEPLPSPKGLSLFTDACDGAAWLYHPGQMEAWMLHRARHEAFEACTNVGYPGNLPVRESCLYTNATFELASVPDKVFLKVAYCGVIDLRINSEIALRGHARAVPVPVRVAVRKFLRPGKNTISIRVHCLEEPPVVLVAGSLINTGAAWTTSVNALSWKKAACFPCVGFKEFPHRERLPRVRIRPGSGNVGEGFDFGTVVYAKPEIAVKKAGGKAVFSVGESLAEATADSGRLLFNEQITEPLTLNAKRNIATRDYAFRYLKVSAPVPDNITGVTAHASLYPVAYRGAFACSDDFLSQLWMQCAYSIRLCMREFIIDGVKRDRLPWAGDLFLSLRGNAYAFGDKNVVRRTLLALYGPDPATAPCNGFVDYSLYWVMSLWEYFLFFDDPDFVDDAREMLRPLLASLAGLENSQGLLVTDVPEKIFIDWAQVDKRGVSCCLQCLYIMALEAASRFMRYAGEKKASGTLSRKAVALRKKVSTLFYNTGHSAFSDNLIAGNQGAGVSQHSNFLAALSGCIAPDRFSAIRASVFNAPECVAPGTPYMKAFEAMAYAHAGHAGLMLDVIRDYWGRMVKSGADTMWEALETHHSGSEHLAFYGRPFGKSLCHAWGAGPLALLSGDWLGIRPCEPGWKTFSISNTKPDVKWLHVSVPTPEGIIEVSWEKNRLRVSMPKGIRLSDPVPRLVEGRSRA